VKEVIPSVPDYSSPEHHLTSFFYMRLLISRREMMANPPVPSIANKAFEQQSQTAGQSSCFSFEINYSGLDLLREEFDFKSICVVQIPVSPITNWGMAYL